MNNIIDELEKEGAKINKKPVKQAKIEEKTEKVEKSTKKAEDNNLFTLVIVTVVILGIIGIVFGYTRDKIAELKNGDMEKTQGLEQQVQALRDELVGIKDKAASIEKDILANKNVVLDLFEKNRSFPRNVNVADWAVSQDPALSFVISYPKTWEIIKPVIAAAEDKKSQPEMLVIQPIGQADFINAISIQTDYADFAKMSLKEKLDIFKELELIDERDFAHGKMLYFINLDSNNKEVPTILALTDDAIYRATFNVSDKKLNNYFEYRKNFEEIMTTFDLQVKAEPEKKKK